MPVARKPPPAVRLTDLKDILPQKLRSPLVVIQGPTREVAEFLAGREPGTENLCYHMDLYEAERLSEELTARGASGRVVAAPDLWDVEPAQTVVYPAPRGGERALKLD